MESEMQPEGLLHAWELDGKGGGRALNWGEVAQPAADAAHWQWLHFDYSAPDIQAWMRTSSDLSELTVSALLQPDPRPRCVAADDGLMVFLRGVNLNPGSDPEDMVSIRLWVGARRVISLRMRRLLSVDDLNAAIRSGNGPATPGHFVVMLTDRLQERMRTIVEALHDQVDALEDEVIGASGPEQREQIAGIRRQTIAMRRFLSPQREALNRLSAERAAVLSDADRLSLREEYDHVTRMVEDLDAARERAAVIHESLASRLAELTNQRMYILSIIAAIFLPLSFVTGLLGINVGGIPGSDNPAGFRDVALLLLVVGGGIWGLFRWRGWF